MPGTNQSITVKEDGVQINTCVRDAGFVMATDHCHNCYELFYVESGECRFLINEKIYDLHTGDFILVPPLELHYTRFLFGSCKRTIIFFRDEDLTDEIRQHIPQSDVLFSEASVFQVPEAYRELIVRCFRQMTSEEKINDEKSPLLRKLHLQALFLICSRVCRFLSDPPVDIHTTDRQIILSAHYISEHYMNPITTTDVAKSVGFSPNHLSRRFRRETGIGLHEYIIFVRLNHAAQELVSTDDSITTIALRCGFSSSNYFKDCFKKKYGVTPRKYRNITLSSS